MEVENERVKNATRLLVGIAVLTVVLFVWDLIVHRNGRVKEIISNIVPSKLQDTYNGVYTYVEELDSKISAFTGCSFSSVNNYILVINDEFYSFRSTCMGTYLKEKGKTDDLNIVEESKSYAVKYKDNLYKRDYKVVSIVPNKKIEEQSGELDLNSLVGIIKETEFEGNYYTIDRTVRGFDGAMNLIVERQENGDYLMKIMGKSADGKVILYSYTINDLDKAPIYYTYGRNLVIIERESSNNKYAYKFKVITPEGTVYDYKDMLPVYVDGLELNYDKNSIYIVYDAINKYFKVFIGKDKEFCVSDGDGKNIAFYEYAIKYDFRQNKFDKPEFVKIWVEGESCSYIKEYLKEAV